MTDDAALVAFLEAAGAAGAKVVAVGDPRQLGSVGPGGGFEAVVRRFGGAVHVLTENVRQVDAGERAALAELRSGNVEAAVSWYAGADRIAVSPDRDTALDATVAGWAADAATGSPAMYAWRRANVAELNRRGRQAWETARAPVGEGARCRRDGVPGRGPHRHPGAGRRRGDRHLRVRHGAGRRRERRELAATMDDGRIQRLGPEEIEADRLAHSYAITVHRSQGATVGRAHVLEDGGGRELAYVKMSRARERSTVYVVADSPEQAAADLRREWSQSRRIGWAIDQGAPAPGVDAKPARPSVPAVSASLRHARLVAERAAMAAAIPSDPGDAGYYRSRSAVDRMERQIRDLDKAEGWGEWKGTPVGEAAAAWLDAVREWRGSLAQAEHAGLRERHRLRQQAERAAQREGPLRDRFEALAAPERARLRAELPVAQRELEETNGSRRAYTHFQYAHPEALRRLDLLDDQIATTAWELDIERQDLDGIRPQPLRHHGPDRGLGREALGLDRGLDLGIGL